MTSVGLNGKSTPPALSRPPRPPGPAGDPEEVAEVAVDPAPAQPAPAATTRLHQPQRVAPHAGVPAALLHGRPDRRRTPRGHAGGVTQVRRGVLCCGF